MRRWIVVKDGAVWCRCVGANPNWPHRMSEGWMDVDHKHPKARLFASKGAATTHATRGWTTEYWRWCRQNTRFDPETGRQLSYWDRRMKREFEMQNPRDVWMRQRGLGVVEVQLTLQPMD